MSLKIEKVIHTNLHGHKCDLIVFVLVFSCVHSRVEGNCYAATVHASALFIWSGLCLHVRHPWLVSVDVLLQVSRLQLFFLSCAIIGDHYFRTHVHAFIMSALT